TRFPFRDVFIQHDEVIGFGDGSGLLRHTAPCCRCTAKGETMHLGLEHRVISVQKHCQSEVLTGSVADVSSLRNQV
ncbi:hypothetical protein, partial [Escherichia coli]|uniref:hypothetical protein n=1 Tax=Escherichia coli TaxID=562 RepID=UPI00381A297C